MGLCSRCGGASPPSRTNTWCAACLRDYNDQKFARAQREAWSDNSDPSEVDERGDLYIFRNSRIPGEYKVGRSKSIQKRRSELQSSQNYEMLVVASSPSAGVAEGAVHARLAYCKVRGVPGRELFCSPLADIRHAVSCELEQIAA